MYEIRVLRAEDVELRLKRCIEGKGQYLLYIDSRACRKILDETFGIMGWQDRYQSINGVLYCTISIWDEKKSMWIDKQDCGSPSFVEKNKGEASDAFKRACYSLGIGRELYTKIPIWLHMETEYNESKKAHQPKRGKKPPNVKVTRLEVDESERKIRYLCITNGNNKDVFNWGFPLIDNDYYIDENTEKCREALISSCRRYAEIKGCTPKQAFLSSMRGQPYNENGYIQGLFKIQQAQKELENGTTV